MAAQGLNVQEVYADDCPGARESRGDSADSPERRLECGAAMRSAGLRGRLACTHEQLVDIAVDIQMKAWKIRSTRRAYFRAVFLDQGSR